MDKQMEEAEVVECYSCGCLIKKDGERHECYCNDCGSLSNIELQQTVAALKEEIGILKHNLNVEEEGKERSYDYAVKTIGTLAQTVRDLVEPIENFKDWYIALGRMNPPSHAMLKSIIPNDYIDNLERAIKQGKGATEP